MGKQITLKQLELTNYRNIKHQVLNFNGNSKIIGDNRIGKTNTLESIYWLFTDKLLNGSKDIDQIKPLSDTKAKVQVTATFDVDGKTIKLGKEFQEEWVKTRGTEDLVFKGHSTTYLYNGVKQGTKKQFDALFNEDFGINNISYQGIDVIQLLVNPLYLGKMGDTDDWKNLRAMIIDIVGDVQDDDVFNTHLHLSPIKEDLKVNNGRTDQVIKGYRDTIKTLETDLVGYDANIDLLERTECPSDEMVATARKGIEDCESNIRSLENDAYDDKAINLIDQEINDLKSQIIEIKRHDLEHKKKSKAEIRMDELTKSKADLLDEVQDLVTLRNSKLNNKSSLSYEISNLDREITERQATRTNLIDELRSLDDKMANPSIETECPHCHRPYDDKELENQAALVLKELNERKVALITTGKENSAILNDLIAKKDAKNKELGDFIDELSKLDDSARMLNTKLSEINNEIATLSIAPDEPVINPVITQLEEKIKQKEDEKFNLRNSLNDKELSIKSLIAGEQEKKEEFQKILDNLNYYNRVQEQIVNVRLEKDAKAKKLISLEQKVELVKEFVKIKLEMLDSNIKRVFDDVSFMLIEPQINGGYATVCKPYIKGTKTLWKSGSKSEQVTTGIAIAEKIKTALNLPNFPYLFDEGGEISTTTFSTKFVTESQLICVQVKDGITIPTVINI